MIDTFTFHEMKLSWLLGGHTALDGGAMFGVVPKPLWSKKYPVDDKNRIETPTDPILIQYKGKNYLIDAGVGLKMTEKQIRNFGILTQPKVDESLNELGLSRDDIDYILLTHFHYDHASGLTHFEDGKAISSFPNATIYVNQIEWDDVRNPNVRSKNTYWKENWEPIVNQVRPFRGNCVIEDGIEMIHVGGHSRGLCIVKLTQNNEVMLHMSDLMATHAHQNELWVMAYDDYPMDSIDAKVKILKDAYKQNTKFFFYHDAFYRVLQWDQAGRELVYAFPRSVEPIIKF